MNKKIKNAVHTKMAETDFDRVLEIIKQGKIRAFQAVNVALIDTYWQVGHYLSSKAVEAGWGKGVVKELAAWLSRNSPDLKGFSASNLWRMKQFFETYSGNEKLAPLVRELSWTNNLLILAQCKTIEELEKVRLQVGNTDFELDLLFYHRDLQCLVAFELKTGKFEPSQLGQLSFYLEALDRDHKRSHEKHSIGVLLCRNKDDEVVEYALNRTLSPALVAEYETKMIPKALLKQKMHEWTALIEGRMAESEADDEKE